MQRTEEYNTIQKQRILATIKKQERSFTAKDIYQELKKEIGLTTIYRYLEKMLHDGVILKVDTKDNSSVYQYIKPCNALDHFYLKCEKCGKIEHVDCEKVEGLSTHIYEHHHFRVTSKHIVINGICAKCEI